MAEILTVSISREQKAFIDEFDLSPSELIQMAINEEMVRSRTSTAALKEKEAKILRLQENIQQYVKFIESKGLFDEYFKTAN